MFINKLLHVHAKKVMGTAFMTMMDNFKIKTKNIFISFGIKKELFKVSLVKRLHLIIFKILVHNVKLYL